MAKNEHGPIFVAIQTKSAMLIPEIRWYCNRPGHQGCREEVRKVLASGGTIVKSSVYAQRMGIK